MSSRQYLRELISERLTAAAEEIFRAFEGIIVEYEEEVDRQRSLLEVVWKPDVKLQRIERSQQHVDEEKPVLSDQLLCHQERNREGPESLQMKDGHQEVCSSREGGQCVMKQEAHTFMLTPDNEKSAHMEPEPHTDHQLLSPVADSAHCPLTQMPTQTDGKPYSCVTCGKHFVSRSYLTVHIRTHTGEKPFSCSICGKRFNASTNLTKHMKTHTGEKPHSCSVCGKRFNASTNLTKHMRTHTGEKPYPCSTCGRRFNASPNLKMHMRTHTGEKPHICSICKKSFRRKDTLTYHTRTHTGEKPYICDICEKSFTWKATWLDHMRTHQVRNPVQPVGNNQVSQKM